MPCVEATRTRTAWTVLAAVASSAVVVGTMWPDSTVNTANFVPLREHAEALWCVLSWCDTPVASLRFAVIDVIGNVVVFVPIGLGLAGMLTGTDRRRLWTAVALGFALSLTIEAIQSTIPTRATDIDDLIFNTLGTAIGAGMLIWWQRYREIGTL